jgi:hypothetical protein
MKLVKRMVNLREILGLDNIVIKITFGFALVMLTMVYDLALALFT